MVLVLLELLEVIIAIDGEDSGNESSRESVLKQGSK